MKEYWVKVPCVCTQTGVEELAVWLIDAEDLEEAEEKADLLVFFKCQKGWKRIGKTVVTKN
jgi:hypothetical protein